MAIELLLADESGRAVLSEGLPDESAASPPKDPPVPKEEEEDLIFPKFHKDPNDLTRQRWGIVVPEGVEGKRLEEIIAPLIAARKEQQGGNDPIVYHVPSGMTAERAGKWWSDVYKSENIAVRDRPEYLLILGAANQISWETQQRFASSAFVGRLAFAEESHYEAYVHKLLAYERAERNGRHKLRTVFHTVRDGTAATTMGHRGLMSPTVEMARNESAKNEFPASQIMDLTENGTVSPDDFLTTAAQRDPTLLFSISHGVGSPAEASEEERRRIQGAMSLGQGQRITAEDVANGPFLPGGAWFFFACFSAGTPSDSAYRHWLETLKDAGANVRQRDIDGVLAALAREKSFVAALPQAALANPDGPLAVMGHVDLAWTFSFQDSSKRFRSSRFHSIFQGIVDHARIGCSFYNLQGVLNDANSDLTDMLDTEERARRRNDTSFDTKSRSVEKASLWMLRQDLTAYVLLGDPAARVAAMSTPEEVRKVPSIFTNTVTNAVTNTVIPAASPMATPTTAAATNETGSFAEAPTTAPNALADMDPARIESAVFAAVGTEAMDAIAKHFGVTREVLDGWVNAYKEGGRAAVQGKRSV